MSALTPGDIFGGRWRIVRPAFGDAPGSEFQVVPVEEAGARRITLWRTLRAPIPTELERFEQLLRAGERTKYPAFQPVVDVGYDPACEALWCVRPWWNGESLPSMLGGLHEVGLEIPYLHSLAEQLARALTLAQEAGVAHGRLRPSRLLVAPGPKGVRLSILDLGLEVFRRDHAHAWLKPPPVGEAYVAPELGDSGPVLPSADVFSFGLIVRDMLATRRDGAWTGRWESWVEQATAAAPEERFRSLTEAMRALVPVLKSLPDPRPPPPENYQREQPASIEATPPEPAPPEPPPAAKPRADFEDLVELFAGALPSSTKHEVENGVVFRSELGDAVFNRVEGQLELTGIRWMLPLHRTWSAAEEFVEQVLEVAKLCTNTPLAPSTLKWKAELLSHVDIRPRQKEGAEHDRLDPLWRWRGLTPYEPGIYSSGLDADEQLITAVYAHQAWVTSHDLDWCRSVYAWIPWTSLPAGLERAVSLLNHVERVSYLMNAYPSYVCRFCRGTFESLHFHTHHEACHRCSETHLGIIH
ncbi:hypothetical protein [Vitiosangium sp. GDMCC 1.1324]|uniref:hypothetical protein n=1 Tax=Vitiosangium sp. (strain GDMCC 1.1324) TaxID=2138576 RepID=UPI0011B54DDF|nr:hypothetical protein [Vitiosangium sp. GDMCC 1.1324]